MSESKMNPWTKSFYDTYYDNGNEWITDLPFHIQEHILGLELELGHEKSSHKQTKEIYHPFEMVSKHIAEPLHECIETLWEEVAILKAEIKLLKGEQA
jgi:hypothetical protein